MNEINQFENIVLKQLTSSGEYFGKATPIIEPKYFLSLGNQELFKLIKTFYNDYHAIPKPVELVSMVKNVQNEEIRKEIINSIQNIVKTPQSDNLKFMLDETVKWVKDVLYTEALQVGADGLMKKDDNLKLKAQEILDKRSKISIDSYLGLSFKDLDTMLEYYSSSLSGILTQHDSLNKRLGPGFLPGTLSLILAASGVGKTLLMNDIISGQLLNKKNVLLISLEMSEKENMKRIHANSLNIPVNSFLDLSKDKDYFKDLKLSREILTREAIINSYNKIKDNVGELYIREYAPGEFSPLMLENLIKQFELEKNIKFDIVFVDYLGIMKSDKFPSSVGLYSYVKSIAEELRGVAMRQQIPIISASQLSRGATNKTQNDGIDNEKVSDSYGTVMTADFMLFLLQDEKMKESENIVCKVTKNRFNGMTDFWEMNIDYSKMRFWDKKDITDITSSNIDGNILSEAEKIKEAERIKNLGEFANNEIKSIYKNDLAIALKEESDTNIKKEAIEQYENITGEKITNSNNDIDDLLNSLI